MDIIIHGTKGGRKVFTPKKISGLLDVTADGAKSAAIGQEAYAIRMTAEHSIFSKYKIIRDVRGDKRTGFIGFSLFLPNGKKLSGKNTIQLLDSVSEEYCRNYAPDNNLDEVIEKWDFLDTAINEYKNQLKSVDDSIPSGSKDDAFVYFKDTDELKRYFDVPVQEKYSDYRQILFVKNDLKDKEENPLNALRHSENDLTGKIDWDNPRYKLLFKKQDVNGLNIEVKEKGEPRDNGDMVRRKNILKINYFQKFRKTIPPIEGTWEDIKMDYSDCIEIDDENETITIKPMQLKAEVKTISISAIDDWTEKRIKDFQVKCLGINYHQAQKEVNNYQIEFEGDEIGESWIIEVTANDYQKGSEKIVPEKVKNVTFELIPQKFLTVEVKDSNTNKLFSPYDYELSISAKKGLTKEYNIVKGKNEIVFEGDEIGKDWRIQVKKRGYRESGKTVAVFPQNMNTQYPIIIYIEKKEQISINKHIKLGIIIFGVVAAIGGAIFFFVFKPFAKTPEAQEQQITHSIDEKEIVNATDSVAVKKDSGRDIQDGSNSSENQTSGSRSESGSTVAKTVNPPINDDIIKYLTGSELRKSELETFKTQTTNSNLKKSIELALKFWILDGTENNTYHSFQKELQNDIYLKNSDLKEFVDEMCSRDSRRYIPAQDQNRKLSEIINRLR